MLAPILALDVLILEIPVSTASMDACACAKVSMLFAELVTPPAVDAVSPNGVLPVLAVKVTAVVPDAVYNADNVASALIAATMAVATDVAVSDAPTVYPNVWPPISKEMVSPAVLVAPMVTVLT